MDNSVGATVRSPHLGDTAAHDAADHAHTLNVDSRRAGLLNTFENHGNTLLTANTHGGQSEAALDAVQLMDGLGGYSQAPGSV